MSDAPWIPTSDGSLYLAVILDACSRRIVGWHMSSKQTISQMLGALEVTARRRKAAEERDPQSGD
ncbi:MAG: DDE-type integrase/transposase/recombinase [Pseudomonadales bacterium]|nr:DDE-type integrase/transposase/recombinase [Pseudomonadales bacterium]